MFSYINKSARFTLTIAFAFIATFISAQAISLPSTASSTAAAVAKQTLNINKAPSAQLQKLPGINETLANAIISYREENGNFKKASDLIKVPGISEDLIAAIGKYLRFSDSSGKKKTSSSSKGLPAGFRVSINAGSASDLQKLPGIGPSLSGRIIDYRKANGPFLKLEDLKKVKGIGDSTFKKIKSFISL